MGNRMFSNVSLGFSLRSDFVSFRLTGFRIGVVLRSENPDIKVGEHVNIDNRCRKSASFASTYRNQLTVIPSLAFQEYAVIPKSIPVRVLQDEGIPWSKYLGIAGMPGATAWLGYHALIKGKPVSEGALGMIRNY